MFSYPFLHPRFVLFLLLVFSSFAGFAQVYVDDDAPNDTGAGTMADPKQFIQSGIDLATSGQTVFVIAGTYNESINIDKPLTLQGPNVGVTGNGARGLEATIEPASQGNAIQITADNVTIDGLQVGVGNVDAAIYQTDQTDIIIQNNVINADSVGVAMVGTGVLTGSINVNNNFVTIADFLTSNTSSLATGVALVGLSGTIDIDLSDNLYSGGAQAIFVFGCLSTNILNISDESVTNAIRGISVFSFNGVVRASSTLQVNGMSVTNFDEPVSEIAGFPQAGIYFYTDGSSTGSHIITATVSNSTFSGTSNSASDYAGIICGDFSSTDYVVALQDITINESTFSNNENRGIQIRGQNTSVSISRSTFENNGFNPNEVINPLSGNHGFHVVVRNDAITTIDNSFFINPVSQTGDEFDGLSLQAGSSLSITNSFFNQNGNGTIAGTSGIDLSSNNFGTIDEAEIVTLVGASNDITPWIESSTDTDMGTAGFQPDLDSLYVGTSGIQTGSAGRIDEAIGLVDAGGTVIVSAGTYSETVTADKAVNLIGANVNIPASSPRIAETIIEPSVPFDVGFTVDADNVAINGFQIGTGPSSSNVSNGIVIDGQSELTVQNNIVHANSAGMIAQNLTSGSTTLSDNAVTMLDLEDGVTATLPSTGIQLLSISGDVQVSVNNNDISNASLGIGGYALTSTNITIIDGGNFTTCTQGITVNNTNGAGGYSPSNINIQNVTMSAFQAPNINVVAPDAEAGIYLGTFSGGTDQDTIVAIINNVDISGVSAGDTDYSGIYVADFIDGGVPFNDVDEVALTVTINTSNIHDNANRGVFSRGANSITTINRSTFSNNVNAAVLGSEETEIYINNSFIQLPSGSGVSRGLATQSAAYIDAYQNSLDLNGNSNIGTKLATLQELADSIDLSANWFNTPDETTIAGLVDAGQVDFSPWIASGTDTNPSFAGFQPDLSTLHVGTSGDQAAGGIIQEGHDLVDTLGTVVVNGNSYAIDTLDVLKDITLSPLVSLTIDELVTDGGNLTVIDNDLTVTSILTLNNGAIDLDEDEGVKTDDPVLTITGATVSGTFSDANHIEGKVASDIGAAASLEFPVGDNGNYRPVTITPVNASTFEVAHYTEAAPNGGGSSDPDLGNLIGDVSTAFGPAVIQSALTTRYWNIDRTSGTGNTNVGLQVLDSDMEVEPGTLSVAKLNSSGDWEEITRVGESGSDPYIITGQTSEFSPFSMISAFGMAPANVDVGLQLWLKADEVTGLNDNDPITSWADMSGLGTDAEEATNPPSYRDNATDNINFNPVILTDGTNDILSTIIDPLDDTDDFSIYYVADNSNMVTRGRDAAGDGWSVRSGSRIFTNDQGDVDLSIAVSTSPTIHSLVFDQGTSLQGYRNNLPGTENVNPGTSLRNSTDSVNIGIDNTVFEAGRIAELIIYSAVSTPSERNQIESYLAIKYGITLDQTTPTNYIASDGGTVWDAGAGYNNDVAGIGRDDFSGLDQRKSRTINADSLVTIALGDFDNPTAFADNDAWLLWGNDNGSTTFGTSIDNAHSGTSSRIGRVWRIQETGTVGTVELAFKASASTETISLIVHPSDETFPNDNDRQVYEIVYSTTTDDYRVTVDLTNGDYFTFSEGPVGGIPAVLISEVITDPQQQWQESGFHDSNPGGIAPFASSDDWIELFITQNNIDLSGYTIDLIDSDTVSGGLGASEAFTVSNYNSITGGLFQATDSGDFVILGQLVTGAMNQDIQVILRDGNGIVVDQVLIENVSRGTGFNGNSTGVEDESVTRLFNDSDTNDDAIDFVLTKASLGTTDVQTGIVLINEVVTDPQTDWSENDFDGTDGGNTPTPVDEWIELYIGSDDLNLTNWTLDIENGANDIIQQDLSAGGAFTISNYFSQTGGTFTKTDSGDYLVLGNAAENLINSPEITLYDPAGNVIDQVVLGGGGSEAPNGNADEFDNEAIARYPNATDTGTDNIDFIQTRPTLGSTNSPSGTVFINEVVTDPQQDWATNGFDGTIGGGSVTPSDEWIELYIDSDSINLTNWEFSIDGDTNVLANQANGGIFDVLNYISNSPDGSFVNTREGDYIILGDPTGDMNLNLFLTLSDAEGNSVDDVEIGDDDESDGDDGAPSGGSSNGSATGVSDEAIARIPNATDTNNDINDFEATIATLGRANSTAPISDIGNALDFGGVDEFVQVSDVGAAIDLNSGAFTVEFWANITSAIAFPLAKGTGGTDNEYFFEIDASGNIEFGVHTDTDAEQTSGLSTTDIRGGWHHIAGVLTGGNILIYIDGVLENQLGWAGTLKTNVGDLFIASQSTGDFITGSIDEVRIWNDIRTQEEILENLNSTIDPSISSSPNLVAYYRFDQSSGSSLPDLSTNNLDGSLNNMEDTDWIPADWPVYAENSTIVQSASGNQTTSGSGQLSILDASFLNNNDDILLVGHEASDFDTVTTELPTGTLVTNRYARSWHLTKNDASGTDGGSVTMSFEIGQEPDSSITYYLLETSDPTTDFAITPIVGYQPGATSVDFTLDVDSLTDEQYYTLGWSDGGPGNALDFDGVDDFVDLALIDLSSGDAMTIEAWVKPNDITTNTFYHINRQELDWLLAFQDNGTILSFGLEANSSYSELDVSITAADYTDGNWHHIAAVYDGTNKHLYSDGMLIGTEAKTGNIEFSSTSNTLGSFAGVSQFFDGEMDEVRIWNEARTQEEILDNMNTNLAGDETNLVAYYRFNEGIGNDPYNLPDLSGSNNNGQLQDFDNLDNSTTSSNFVTADRSSLDANVTIINTTVDVLSNNSEELTLTSTTADFLQDEGDFITWGHDGNDFTEVSTDLPSSSNLATRMDKTWQLTKGDVSDNDGLVTFAFDLGVAPDSDYTYYLLRRSGTSGTFDITEVLGSYPDDDSVKFTIDASQIVSTNYFNLGRSAAGPGHALNFDGTDSIAVADNNLLDLSSSSFTVEAWVNSNQTTGTRTVLSKDNGDTDLDYQLHQNGTNWEFRAGDASVTLTSVTAITADSSHHLAAVYDGSSTSLYVNGQLEDISSAALTDGTNAAALLIGASDASGPTNYFDGEIDEVRIWSDARTQEEIQANLYRSLDVANESNLVAYYRFDDGIASGTNTGADSLADYSGNDLIGLLPGFGLAGATSNWVLSEAPLADASISPLLDGPGNALAFDGVDEYVEVVDNASLDITGTLTLETWINLTTSPPTANEGIISKFLTAGDQQSFSLDINTGDSAVFTISANGSNSAIVSSENSIPVGEWVHLSAVYDPSSSMQVYVNGILDGELTSNVPAIIHSGSADLWIGVTSAINANNAIDATIDEVRIWNTARTRVELQDNMFKQLEGNESGLVAYYTFDEITGTNLPDESPNNNAGTLQNMETADWVSAAAREPEKNIEANNWNTTATWKSRVVPDAITERLDLGQDIIVDGPVDVDLLNINSGVTVTIETGQTLTVNGNFINNGTITGDGTLVINGGTPILYGGTISNLQLAGADATLMSATTVGDTLDLSSNSTLNIDDYNLMVNQISGFSSSAYIETKNQSSPSGYIIKSLAVADGDFTFPVGSSGSYTPLTVKNLGNTGDIEARVFDNTYAQGTSGPIITTEKEVNKSWEINGDAGVNVTVTLQWNGTDEDPNFASARSTAYMSKNDYNWWEKITPDVGVTGSDPYMIAASGIQTFSVFGTGTEDSSLPVTWMAFEAFENENQEVELHWSTASELNNDRFEVEKSFDGNAFQVIGEIAGNGTVNTLSDYEFMDTEPFNGINYYRLRQVDYDGTDDYSELVSVFVDVQREYNITLSPNPTFDITTLNIDWERDGDYAVGIFDMMGRNLGVVHSKFSELNLDLTTLPKGMYIIKIHTGDRIVAKKLIKH